MQYADIALHRLVLNNFSVYFLGIILVEWMVSYLVNRGLNKRFGTKLASLYNCEITFIGVIHHELSHAILALFTGAHVQKICLYRIPWTRKKKKEEMDENCLGYVTYSCRGIFPLPQIQNLLTGIAPIALGTVSTFFLRQIPPEFLEDRKLGGTVHYAMELPGSVFDGQYSTSCLPKRPGPEKCPGRLGHCFYRRPVAADACRNDVGHTRDFSDGSRNHCSAGCSICFADQYLTIHERRKRIYEEIYLLAVFVVSGYYGGIHFRHRIFADAEYHHPEAVPGQTEFDNTGSAPELFFQDHR